MLHICITFTRPVKGQEALKAVLEVVVDAIRQTLFLTVTVLFLVAEADAKILPQDGIDTLYHAYDGGGVVITGPSVLVRKAYKDKVSLWGNYYVDMISGASIDVEATASKYSEKRTEYSAGADYLYDKTQMGIGFTHSTENDYEAKTLLVSLSQDFFGDLTTLSLGYAFGDDTVNRTEDDVFEDTAQHQIFNLAVSQVLTRHLIINLGYTAVIDEGFLNNPYRSVRYLDPTSAQGYSYQAELYPRTRTSDALAIRAMHYLPYRAVVRGEYRFYTDSWGVDGQNAEISYTHPFGERWELDARVRTYSQNNADFYADIFPYHNAQNFLARDKELATFDNTSIGLGISYLFLKGSLNFNVDYIQFDYDDFSNVLAGATVGEEPLYGFNAIVTRIYFTLRL